MKVPNIEQAFVPREKIEEYLLSFTHPRGREKARFFSRFGFSRDEWEVFAAALREHARAHEVSEVTTTVRGTQYRVEGAIVAPDERRLWIRVIWMIDAENPGPRLITAYPVGRVTE